MYLNQINVVQHFVNQRVHLLTCAIIQNLERARERERERERDRQRDRELCVCGGNEEN